MCSAHFELQKKELHVLRREITRVIPRLVVENCKDCIIDHGSQTQYQYLMMKRDEQLCLYFDHALGKVSEASVMKAFIDSSISNIKGLRIQLSFAQAT